ncbi:hypothetical protein AMECASPLE_033486 [Ameca splendens]|uniref:Uncharacterized protein n=1 Tax=Ameca splendens TaxID=208324 RepID=A0ABV0ZGQ0_9TELE
MVDVTSKLCRNVTSLCSFNWSTQKPDNVHTMTLPSFMFHFPFYIKCLTLVTCDLSEVHCSVLSGVSDYLHKVVSLCTQYISQLFNISFTDGFFSKLTVSFI